MPSKKVTISSRSKKKMPKKPKGQKLPLVWCLSEDSFHSAWETFARNYNKKAKSACSDLEESSDCDEHDVDQPLTGSQLIEFFLDLNIIDTCITKHVYFLGEGDLTRSHLLQEFQRTLRSTLSKTPEKNFEPHVAYSFSNITKHAARIQVCLISHIFYRVLLYLR